jgi:hypothetical protein
MKTRRDFIPTDHEELCAWLVNFNLKFASYASTLGFTTEQITAALKDIEWAIYFCQMLAASRGEEEEAAGNLDLALYSQDQSQDCVVQTITFPTQPAGGVPKRGLIKRIRALVKDIKDADAYTAAMGQDMGIVAMVSVADLTTVQPQAGARALPDFRVEIFWNKVGFKAVRLRRRKTGQTSWTDLGLRTAKKFIDEPPASAPNQPDTWEYELIFTVHDENVGQWSNTLRVTTRP